MELRKTAIMVAGAEMKGFITGKGLIKKKTIVVISELALLFVHNRSN